MRYKIAFILLFMSQFVAAQNKYGNAWIWGNFGLYAQFDGNNFPTVSKLFNSNKYFINSHSSIGDSVTGKLRLACNGFYLIDSSGAIIQNGDHLVPDNIYYYNAAPSGISAQTSLILPRANNTYYVFICTTSDSNFNYYFTNPFGDGRGPFDLLMYNIVDMNANSGAGNVIVKNKILLEHTELSQVGMQACRHSNGKDWWLVKQGADSNIVYRFLVTQDSIYGPYTQGFSNRFGPINSRGQSAFNTSGTMYAYLQWKQNKLFLADFDRCTGEMSNPRIVNIPIDSTTVPMLDTVGFLDSITNGVCFSANDSFVYISKSTNIYQYEYSNPDSATAWYIVKHGLDTTFQYFEQYETLQRGIDGRIYIGKFHAVMKQLSVINASNLKGGACDFCRKCLRLDTTNCSASNPPNNPNYLLGASAQTCWPLELSNEIVHPEVYKVFPNPARDYITFKYDFNNSGAIKSIVIRDITGNIIHSKQLNGSNGEYTCYTYTWSSGYYLYTIESVKGDKNIGKIALLK